MAQPKIWIICTFAQMAASADKDAQQATNEVGVAVIGIRRSRNARNLSAKCARRKEECAVKR